MSLSFCLGIIAQCRTKHKAEAIKYAAASKILERTLFQTRVHTNFFFFDV
jgi:hypothetical protein